MDEMKLKKHIERLRKGRKKSFDVIMKSYGPKLYGFIASINRYEHCNDDIYQDVCLKIYRKIDTFDGQSFSAWIFRIAKNTVIDYSRKQKVTLLPLEDDIKSEESLPEIVMEQKVVSEYLADWIEELPDLDKRLILLRYFDELSYREIGSELGLEVKEVKWRLFEAKNKLRRKADRNEVAYGL